MTQLKGLIEKLVKGGEIDQGQLYLTALKQTQNDDPKPEPEELEKIIKEVLDKHEKTRKLGIELVKQWVDESSGEFGLTLAYKELGVMGHATQEAIIRENLHRLVQKGVIVPAGRKRGVYRKVEAEAIPLNFENATAEPMDLTLPFDLDKMINVYPGNIIVVAGEPDTGKTAFCIDFVKRNMNKFPINYFSSEMGESEFRIRLNQHEDITLEEWNFKAFERSTNFGDVVRPGEINIVDYLEVHDNFWLVARDMAHIHDKLRGGLSIVALQKGKFAEAGRGGDFSMEKPRLYVTLSKSPDHQGGIAKILKAKNWKSDWNPNGRVMPYKLLAGAKFIFGGSWEYAESREMVKKPGRLY